MIVFINILFNDVQLFMDVNLLPHVQSFTSSSSHILEHHNRITFPAKQR